MNDADAARGIAEWQADPAAELAALRARLREVEAALGLPARPGQPVPPPLPALLRRVTTLERQVGIVPGLDPLPALGRTAPRDDSAAARTRRQRWLERGQAALAAVLVLAACVWLLRPVPPRASAEPPALTAAPATPVVFTVSAPAFVPDQFTFREDHRADAR
jgi:hypothetical protein